MIKQFNGSASQDMITTGLWSPINTIVQGTGDDNRVGREIILKRLRGRFFTRPTSTLSISGEALRFILLYDKHCNATLTSTPFPITDLLTSALPTAPFVESNADRFIILYDRFWHAPGFELVGGRYLQGWGATSQDTFSFEFDLDVSGLPCVYGDVVGAPPITGALYCVFVGSALTSAVAKFVTGGICDIQYVDN